MRKVSRWSEKKSDNANLSTEMDEKSFVSEDVPFISHENKKNHKDSLRTSIAFWILGLVNNISYVIMIAGAKDIAANGIGFVYIADIVPSLLIKLTLPYWQHLVSYNVRICICTLLMFSSFVIVASSNNINIQLLGVACSAAQCGLGEASILALASKYDTRKMLTLWSSGTGIAGIAGYAWIIFFTDVLIFSFSTTIYIANVIPIVLVLIFFFLLPKPPEIYEDLEYASISEQETENENSKSHDMNAIGTYKKFNQIISLWPYMLPLFFVYFAEYSMQSGAWAAIGFPVDSEDARKTFYRNSNWCYQVGVFISRSSGTLWQAKRLQLWIMPMIQVAFLIFFVTDSVYQFWYNNWLLIPAFMTGLLGGAVYVNAVTLISKEVENAWREFSLTAASLGADVGLLTANVTGLFIQSCLYKVHAIKNADVPCPF